jgi:hypothetical protein
MRLKASHRYTSQTLTKCKVVKSNCEPFVKWRLSNFHESCVSLKFSKKFFHMKCS